MNYTWIWNENALEKNAYVDFAADFTLKNVYAEAEIFISVDTEYAIWLNGQFVGCGQYSDFPGQRTGDKLSVNQFLNPGKNRLCITVYYQGESSHQYAKGQAGLWFCLTNGAFQLESNSSVLSAVSPVYQQGEMYKTTVQLGFGFCYDATKEDLWKETNKALPERFTNSVEFQGIVPRERPIEKCRLVESKGMNIITQGVFFRKEDFGRIALNMHRDFLSFRPFDEIFDKEDTKKVISDENIYIVVDLSRETCGYITFSLDAEEGAVVDYSYGEHLEDLRVRAGCGYRNFANNYRCKEGKQTFTHYFKRIAGRYLELHITGKVRSISHVGVIETIYPLRQYLSFHSEDSLHNRIFEVCRDTLVNCMHNHYEDCPWREQALYGGDSRNQILCGYYAFREFVFPRASLSLLGQSVCDDGHIKMVVPSDNTTKIPSYTFCWLLSMKEYLEHSGDCTLAAEFLETMRFMVGCYRDSMHNGVAQHPRECWNFYEWAEGCDGTRKSEEMDGLYQIFMYIGLQSIACMAEALSDTKLKNDCEALMRVLYNAVNKYFWNAEKQLYATFVTDGLFVDHYCELMQVMAIFSGIAGDKTELLCKTITTENTLIKSSLMCVIFKYEALMQCNNKYINYVYEDIAKRWGAMLYNGATSFWETEDGHKAFDNAGSLCHGWAAVPLYIYGRYACKITPEDIRNDNVDTNKNVCLAKTIHF